MIITFYSLQSGKKWKRKSLFANNRIKEEKIGEIKKVIEREKEPRARLKGEYIKGGNPIRNKCLKLKDASATACGCHQSVPAEAGAERGEIFH